MTYLIRSKPVRAISRPSLGATMIEQFFSPLVGANAEVACLNEANARVAPLDAQIANLSKSWQTTGFYTPAQITAILQEGVKLGSNANEAVRAAPNSTGDAASVKAQAIGDVTRKIAEGQKYAEAGYAASQKGIAVVSAPGLRAWALSMMRAASNSLVTGAVLDCNMPWLATMIIKFQQLFNVAAAVFMKAVGVVVAIGETVLNVAGDLPEIWTVVKWGGLAAVGLAVAIKLGQMRKRST